MSADQGAQTLGAVSSGTGAPSALEAFGSGTPDAAATPQNSPNPVAGVHGAPSPTPIMIDCFLCKQQHPSLIPDGWCEAARERLWFRCDVTGEGCVRKWHRIDLPVETEWCPPAMKHRMQEHFGSSVLSDPEHFAIEPANPLGWTPPQLAIMRLFMKFVLRSPDLPRLEVDGDRMVPVAEQILYSVTRIEVWEVTAAAAGCPRRERLRGTATGCFFRYDDGALYIITNKHVLCAEDRLPVHQLTREDLQTEIRIPMLAFETHTQTSPNPSASDTNSSFTAVRYKATGVSPTLVKTFNLDTSSYSYTDAVQSVLTLPLVNSSVLWHFNPAVDLAAVRLPSLVTLRPWMTFLSSKHIEKFETHLKAQYFDVMEEVLMYGFPNGFLDRQFSLPLMRSGSTAYPIDHTYNGLKQGVIDIENFAGSSGSPIFIKRNNMDAPAGCGSFNFKAKPPTYFLGINSSTFVYSDERRCMVDLPGVIAAADPGKSTVGPNAACSEMEDCLSDAFSHPVCTDGAGLAAAPRMAGSSWHPTRTSLFIRSIEILNLRNPPASTSGASAAGDATASVITLDASYTSAFERHFGGQGKAKGKVQVKGWSAFWYQAANDLVHPAGPEIVLHLLWNIKLPPSALLPSSSAAAAASSSDSAQSERLNMHVHFDDKLDAEVPYPGRVSSCRLIKANADYTDDQTDKKRNSPFLGFSITQLESIRARLHRIVDGHLKTTKQLEDKNYYSGKNKLVFFK